MSDSFLLGILWSCPKALQNALLLLDVCLNNTAQISK